MDYSEAKKILDGGRTAASKERRKLANNTYLERRDDSTIAIKLHATDIVIFTPRHTEYQTGGWYTVTTKDRINGYGPMRVHSVKGVWYLSLPGLYAARQAVAEPAQSYFPLPVTVCLTCEGTGKRMERDYWHRADGRWSEDAPLVERNCWNCGGTGNGNHREHGAPTPERRAYLKELREVEARYTVKFFDGIRMSPDGSKVLNPLPTGLCAGTSKSAYLRSLPSMEIEAYFVSRQSNYYDEGAYSVEIAKSLDHSSPGMLTAQYAEEGSEFADPREAAEAAISVLSEWRKDGAEVEGITFAMNHLCYPTVADAEEPEDVRKWAKERYDALPKCERCGELGAEEWSSYESGDKVLACGQYCADEMLAFDCEEED